MALVFPANAVLLRRQHDRDIPPALIQLQDLNKHPFRMLRHPIMHSRELLKAFAHPLRNRRETQRWFEERGL